MTLYQCIYVQKGQSSKKMRLRQHFVPSLAYTDERGCTLNITYCVCIDSQSRPLLPEIVSKNMLKIGVQTMAK